MRSILSIKNSSLFMFALSLAFVPQTGFGQTLSSDLSAKGEAPVSKEVLASSTSETMRTEEPDDVAAVIAPTGTSKAEQKTSEYETASSKFSPISDRILSDPSYLPLKGQLTGDTTYSYTSLRENYKDASGQKLYSLAVRSNIGSQGFSYGITDNLSVNTSLEYTSENYKARIVDGTSERGYNIGFSDPSFGAVFRAIDQKKNPANLDLKVDYRPDLISAEDGTEQTPGAVASGGHTVDFGASVSREMRNLTVSGTAGATYFGDSSAKFVGDNSVTKIGESWAPFIGLDSQTRFTQRFSVNAGALYTYYGDATVSNAVEGYSYTMKRRGTTDAFVAVNYHLVPNKIVASFGYDHYFMDTDSHVDGIPSFENINLKDREENVFLAKLRYVLF